MSNSGSITKESAAAVCTPNIDCYIDGPGSSIQGNTTDNEVARIYDSLWQNVVRISKNKKLLREFYWFSCYPIRCTLDFFIIICYCSPWTFFGLLKYINIKGVGATATRCVGIVWKIYNEEFRMKMAKNASASSGKVDQELWLTYIVPSASTVQRPLTGGRFLKCYDAYI